MQVNPQVETHKLVVDGVVLYVKIDYLQKTVSFVDHAGGKNTFDFTNRTREYLGGWVKIFRALEKATIWADKRLEEDIKRRADVKDKEFLDVMIAISDLEKGKNAV